MTRRRLSFDATAFVSLYLLLLVAIPANLIVKPLGASGTPANILGIVGFVWWFYARMLPGYGVALGRQPVRIALLLLGMAILASLIALYLRPYDPKEATGAGRGILMFLGSAGVCLLVADGIRSRERFETLLRRVVTAATFMAIVALPQFVAGVDLAKWIKIPGLSVNRDIQPWGLRGHFRRVQGTAGHPIEFGVVLGLVFPIALHFMMTAPKGRRRPLVLSTGLIALGVAMSLSRAGFVVLFAGSLMLFATWAWSIRAQALAIAGTFLVGARLAVPGLVGTVRDLFTHITSDTSATARAARYGVAGHYVKIAPFFGRGFFTFLPSLYIIFDNQYLQTVVELGFVGLTALLLLFLIGIFTGRGARRLSSDLETRDLAQALAGSMLGGMLAFATFDGLSYPMATGMVFLLLGCCGAIWRLAREDSLRRLPSPMKQLSPLA